jgi:RNA polymerase sigma-70 factor (ECF subfamily)
MTDEQAMLAVKNGNLDKASILYERYKNRVYGFFLRRGADSETAEDLSQQVFYRMLQYKESYREGNLFAAWLFRIARNLLSDYYLSESKRKHTDLSALKQYQSDATERMEAEEQREQLRNALGQLPDDQREVLLLSRYEELRYEEIGQLMGISVANVKVKVHRAIKQLRLSMSSSG